MLPRHSQPFDQERQYVVAIGGRRVTFKIDVAGALTAALWARDQKPGLYSMADVLGLSDL